MKSKNININYAKAFIYSVIAGAIFIIPFSILNGGFYYLGSDFVEQQVIFLEYCNNAVKNLDVFWSPSVDLGNGFISSFSFYVIGSPFFWFSLLFKAENIYLLMGFLLLVKMGVSGVSSFMYIKQYSSEASALIASVLYTFAGFSISNMNFFHFYDITALAPFLLLALDKTMEKDTKFFFGFWVFILACTNSILFIGVSIYTILYFAVKLLTKDYILTIKKFKNLATQTILGLMASSIFLIPTAISLISNPRVSNVEYDSILNMLILKPIYIAEFVRGLLMPAECIFDRGFFLQGFTNGAELFLPVFSIILVMAYCLNNKKSWITKLLLLSLVFAFVPILNSAFSLFNPEYYTRWYFMPILIMALASALALDKKEMSLKKGYLSYLSLWIIFALIGVWFIFYFKVTFFYNIVIVAMYFIIAMAGFIITLNLRKIQKHKYGMSFILVCVILCSGATGIINSYYHSRGRNPDDVYNLNTAQTQVQLEQENNQYRIGSDYFFMNLGLKLDTPTVTNFSSTINGSSFEFYNAMGIPRTVISQPTETSRPMLNFLSVKYWVSLTKLSPLISMDFVESSQEMGDFTVHEYKNYIPMGFTFDEYISNTDFMSLSNENKQYALLKAIILSDSQIEEYDDILTEISKDNLMDISLYQSDVENRIKTSAEHFEYTNDGAIATITLDKENLVLFSIPYDEGFTAYINGEKVGIEKVNNGFMAVLAQEGENNIEFIYRPVGYYLSLILTALSLIATVVFLFYLPKRYDII